MRALVVYANPNPSSLGAAALTAVLSALSDAGHHARVADLYADGFDPCLSHEERMAHRSPPAERPALDGYADSLRWCDTLIFVYPTWWSGPPAMLKGWFDRVFTSGIAYDLPAAGGRPRPLLRNIRRLVVVTTHGSPRRTNMLEGETGKRTIRRSIRSQCSRRARTSWIAMYNVDRATPTQRSAYLDRVRQRIKALS